MDAAFYQQVRWLELKKKYLDLPAYSDQIHAQLQGKHFSHVLDCGTGAGHFIETLSHLITYDTLRGFDIDATLAAHAQKSFADNPSIEVSCQDLYELGESFGTFDLITAQAMLEHTDMHQALQQLKSLCKPGTWLYFPHNYTSPTLFDPIIDRELDDLVVRNFNHYAMENQAYAPSKSGRKYGDSRCGQKLYNLFTEQGFKVLAYDSTDWILYPKDGVYSEEEKELLSMLINFFYEANLHEGISRKDRIADQQLREWKEVRLAQIEASKLVFICPQTSILVECP